jgi:hypothetical protein
MGAERCLGEEDDREEDQPELDREGDREASVGRRGPASVRGWCR